MNDDAEKPLWLVKMQQEQQQQQQQSQAGRGCKPRLQFPIDWSEPHETLDEWRSRTGGAKGITKGKE